MTPRTEALAFRIRAFANPKDWDCTVQEIAEAVGETPQRTAGVCRVKNWTGRLRSSGPEYYSAKFDTGETWSNDVLIGEEEIVD